MTQSFNLSQLANNVNVAGKLIAPQGLVGTVPVPNGGTGQSSFQNGEILIGNSTGNTLTKAKLNAGTNITITEGPGSISLAASNDYLNFFPTAGVLKENKVPIYADFAFSIQAQGLASFWLTDNQNFDVAYFHVNSPEGKVQVYKAYRFNLNTDFYYDTEPLAVNFATADEYVMCMYNVGTNFAYVILGNNATPSLIKHWIARTNGSSKSKEWQAVADVTGKTYNWDGVDTKGVNFFYMTDPVEDRILRLTQDKYTAGKFTLDVFDNDLAPLRSIDLVVDADYDKDGLSNPPTNGWNTQTYNGHQYSWNKVTFNWISRPPVFAPAFTWNKYTEELLFQFNGYYIRSGSPNTVAGATMTVSWQIPRQWLLSGTGTPTNNISDKGGGKRYKIKPDADVTWNTDTGGMSSHYLDGFGWISSVVTDEYAQRITMTKVTHWSTTDFIAWEFNNVVLKTLGTNVISKQKSPTPKQTLIPDASQWSKITYSWLFHVMDKNIAIVARSNSYGDQIVSVDFFPNKFQSRPIGDPLGIDNTLYLDPTTAKTIPKIGPDPSPAYDPSFYSTTVIAGTPPTPHYYRIKAGSPVEKITLSSGPTGNTRVFSPLPGGFILPQIPGSIGGVTGVNNEINTNLFGPIVYNGNDSNKVFWAVVKGNGSMPSQMFIAKYSSGSWGNIYGPFAQAQADDSNLTWGDTGNRLYTERGCGLLTESGKFMFQFWYQVPGGGKFYVMRFDTVNNTPEIKAIHYGLGQAVGDIPDIFGHTANNRYQSQGGVNGYHGNSFGYSTELGYYCAGGMGNQISIAILSTKDVRKANPTVYTEDDWWSDKTKCHEINFTAEPTVGLFAYLRNFPLFVGGYYGTMPNQVVAVPANKTSWVYAIKPDNLPVADRGNIVVQVSDEYQPSSFKKVNLGSITTVADKIIASEGFDVNPDTWEPPVALTANRTFTFTGRKATGNNGTFNLCVIRGLTVNGIMEIAINFSATGSTDKGSYQKGVFAVGTYVSPSLTGLFPLEASTPVNRTVTGTPFTFTRTGTESLVIGWNGTGLANTDTNFALYLRINTNMFLTINRLNLDA